MIGFSAYFLFCLVALLLELEGVFQAAVDRPAVVDHELRRDLLGGSDAGRAAVARIDAARVLADHDEIDMLRALCP